MKHEELKVVTDDTLKELRGFDVITPNLYSDAFGSKMKDFGIDDKITDQDIPLILDKVLKIQTETQSGIKSLKENIDLATIAINDEDTTALATIKEHMGTLFERIAALEEEVYIDDLTKVYNRKWLFDKVLKDEAFQQEGVLTFVDLDKFKNINDTYGHIAGDKVLFLIANILKKLDGVDIIRYGGDEFIMITFSQSLEHMESHIKKINEGFEHKSFKFQGKTFKVSISAGSSSFKDGDNFHTITNIVDALMYEAKKLKHAQLEAMPA
jgi:diguanylate cyclase (GGDEF)-like protein